MVRLGWWREGLGRFDFQNHSMLSATTVVRQVKVGKRGSHILSNNGSLLSVGRKSIEQDMKVYKSIY